MEEFNKTDLAPKKARAGKIGFYIIYALIIIVVLPLSSVLIEFLVKRTPLDPALIGKWFLFWAVGVRLLIVGIKQTVSPESTGTHIFHLRSKEAFVVIRELGFANISMGLMGILTLFHSEWRQISAITGGLFLGLAGIQHLLKKPDSNNEIMAMFTDLFIFSFMLLYILFEHFS